jgi:Tfp pilus assembly protein PilF
MPGKVSRLKTLQLGGLCEWHRLTWLLQMKLRSPDMFVSSAMATAILSACACVANGAPTTGPASQPVGIPGFSAAEDLALGLALLRDGDFANAKDVFESALKVEPNNARAMHGLALAHYALDQKDKAIIYLERAIRAAPTDRTIVNNLAAVRISTGEPMRGIKALSDYVASLPKANVFDEQLVDALGSALAVCDDKTKKARQWSLSDDVLQQAVTRLERARPGYRKLGTQWVAAEEWTAIDAQNKAERDEIERLGRRAADTQKQIELQEQRRADIVKKMRTGFSNQWELDAVDQQIEMLQDRIKKMRDEAEAADKRIRRPAWPGGLSILAIDAATPPPFAKEPPTSAAPHDPQRGQRGPRRPNRSPADPVEPTDPPPGVLFPPSTATPADPAEAAPKLIVRHAAAFAVSANRIVTSALAVDGASSLKVHLPDGSDRRAKLVRVDKELGLAIVEIPGTHLAPIAIADKSVEGKVAVVSYPALSLFEPHASSLSATVTQLDGELSVVMEKSPGLSGGPAIAGGKVAGVVMTDRYDVSPPVRLITADALRTFLGDDLPKDARPLAGDPEPAVLLVIAEHGGTAPANRPDSADGDPSTQTPGDANPGTDHAGEPTTRPSRPRRDGRRPNP